MSSMQMCEKLLSRLSAESRHTCGGCGGRQQMLRRRGGATQRWGPSAAAELGAGPCPCCSAAAPALSLRHCCRRQSTGLQGVKSVHTRSRINTLLTTQMQATMLPGNARKPLLAWRNTPVAEVPGQRNGSPPSRDGLALAMHLLAAMPSWTTGPYKSFLLPTPSSSS
jgi:hypothetical protein